MSRLLDGTTDYLTTATLPIADFPVTMACWFRAVSFSDTLMWIGDNSAANQTMQMDLTSGNVRALQQSGGASASASSTGGGGTTSVWDHGCAVFAAADDRRAYRAGGLKGTNNTTRAFPTDADQISIGMSLPSTPNSDFSGRVAEVGLWNVALSDAEIAALASGITPLLVRPSGLVHYWPVWGNASPEPDYNPSGSPKLPLTINGTCAQAGHAPVSPMLFGDPASGLEAREDIGSPLLLLGVG